MAKLIEKRKGLLLSSLILVIAGLVVVGVGFMLADHKIEKLRWKTEPAFYQTVRVNEKNQFRIQVQFGPFQITGIN